MQVSSAIAIVAVSAVSLAAAKLWTDWCKHLARKRLKEEICDAIREISQAVDDEPDNVALHLRLRGNLERLCEERRKLG